MIHPTLGIEIFPDEFPPIPPLVLKRFPTEDKMQEYSYQWWNRHFRGISLMHSVPNGADVTGKERMKLVGTGLLRGAADMELKIKGGYCIHIENKNHTKGLDPDQIIFKSRLEALGGIYHKADNFWQFACIVCFYLKVDVMDYIYK